MADRRINVNAATVEELTQLPGIGPALAERIVTYRDTVAPFEEPAQITAVSGIGERTYRAVSDRLAVATPEAFSTPAVEAPQEGIEELEGEAVELAPEEETPSEAAVTVEEEMGPREEIEPEGKAMLVEEPLPEEEPPPDAEVLPEEEIWPEEGIQPEVETVLAEEPLLEEELTFAEDVGEESAVEAPQTDRVPEEAMDEAAPEASDLPKEVTEEIMEEAPSEVSDVFEEIIEKGPPEAQEVSPERATVTDVEEEPTEEQQEAEAIALETDLARADVEEQTRPARSRSWWRRLSWLWTALLGALLGTAFTLVVFSGVNGSLDVGHSHAVVDVRGRVSSLATDISSLQGDVEGLRKRLDALEELTVRMDRVEAAVGDLQEEMAGLDERADALEESVAAVGKELDAVSEQVETLRDQAEQTRSFFQALQALLNDFFGEVEGNQ
jgi:competence ComEA-like helix-hairpin-helix protein